MSFITVASPTSGAGTQITDLPAPGPDRPDLTAQRASDRRADGLRSGRQRGGLHPLGHPSDHEPRPDQQHPDPGAVQRVGVAARERVEAGLGGPVNRVELTRPDRRYRRQDHDRAAAPAAHGLAEREQRRDVPGEVGLDHGRGEPHVPLSLLLRDQDAGRGDDQVGHSPGADLLGERLVGPGLHRVIAGDRHRAGQRLPRRLKPLRVPAGQDDLRVGPEAQRGEDRQADLACTTEQQNSHRYST